MNLEKNKNIEEKRWDATLEGEVDVYNAPDLKMWMHSMLEEDDWSISLDCSGLTYIDSTGLGVLISVLKRVKRNGGTFYLSGLKPYIYRIFTVTGLDKIFEIEDNINE